MSTRLGASRMSSGVGLEGEAPHGELAAVEVVAEARHHLVDQHALLPLVGRFDGLQHAELDARLAAGGDERLHVLREARAAVARARRTGTGSRCADRCRCRRARARCRRRPLGEQRELVHEADARGQHRVGGVLGELGAAHVHHEQPVVVARERRVERAHQQDGVFVVRADDDAVGAA
jgi:hypothetical protein